MTDPEIILTNGEFMPWTLSNY